MTKQTDLTPIYAAASAALRVYHRSFRRGNIIRAQGMLRNRTLSKRLVNFYLEDIDREIDFMLDVDNAA
ncbi:hypothetical protein [Bradyrhizobium phage BDU-MI-1]|nr:hypothetical protein [Bradyrhizobium phage BDU-MI-1]